MHTALAVKSGSNLPITAMKTENECEVLCKFTGKIVLATLKHSFSCIQIMMIASTILHYFSTAALKQEAALDNGATVLNHSMGLVHRMETLLAMGNGSDVTLRVQTINTDEVKVIQAHSLVLTLQSDVFEELLLSRNNSAVVLMVTPDCAAVFDKFVR